MEAMTMDRPGGDMTNDNDPNIGKIDQALRRWEEAKSQRLPYEADWRYIARWCAPDKLAAGYKPEGSNLTHYLHDMSAVDAGERSAALLFGYLFGGREPFAVPRLQGRDKTSYAENVWLDTVRDTMHSVFRSGDVTFRAAMMQTVFDQIMFGTGNMWAGAGLGQLPQYKSTPLWDFWVIFGDNGKPEMCFRRFRLSASAAFRKWQHPKLAKIATKSPGLRLTFLSAVWQRTGGRRGAPALNKPFLEYVIGLDDKIFLEESGYDYMPFAVGRFHTRPGDVYGIGSGHKAAPKAYWMNRLYAATASGAEKSIDPPVWDMSNGAFPDHDRRAGAVNMGTFEALGFSNIREVFQTLPPSGDLRAGEAMLNMAKNDIREAFYIDWMMDRSGAGQRTATEVLDQRDLRFKSLSGFTADTENNLAGPIIDITFRKLEEYGAFPPMPESLRGDVLDFEFRSPLSAAMDQGDVESIIRSLELARNIGELDPSVIDNIDGDAMYRQGVGDYGMKRTLNRSPEDVDDIRQAREEAAKAQEEAQAAGQAAAALRDSAQGLASLENAGLETAGAGQ